VPRGFRCSVEVLTCSTGDLMAVLMNLGPCMRHGGSCACLGAASRVVVPTPTSGHHPYPAQGSS
jgi:hypothetical protein